MSELLITPTELLSTGFSLEASAAIGFANSGECFAICVEAAGRGGGGGRSERFDVYREWPSARFEA